MSKPISAFKLFKPSMNAVLSNFVSFLVIVFLPAFLLLIGDTMNARDFLASPGFNPMNTPENVKPESVPFYIIGGLLSLLLLPAGYYLELQAAKGKEVGGGEAISASAKHFWRIVGFVLIVGLAFLAGIFFLILPGLLMRSPVFGAVGIIVFFIASVMAIQRFFLVPYFIIDRNVTMLKAMSESAAASKGRAFAIWGVVFVAILLGVFNVIPKFGGLISLILITLYTCAPALRYLELSNTKS